jgi:hypothetical protein
VAGGVAVARQAGSVLLLDSVRTAFIHAMDAMLWSCGGIAIAGALLAFKFLPRRPAGPADSASISLPEQAQSQV